MPLLSDSSTIMDAHTLGLLEFDKVRELLAGYAASSLGRDLARQVEPLTDVLHVRREQSLVSEMRSAVESGQSPPFGGLHDVRLLVRRASIGTMLDAEQLLEISETLACVGAIYRYRSRLDSRLGQLIDLLSGIDDLGVVAKTIGGCIDGRGHILDMASHELAAVRQRLFELDEKVKAEVKRLLRDPELRKILSYPNATVNGDHYVLPVAVNHRHKVPGVVHRVSGTGETLFIEPASIAKLSVERVTLKAEEEREEKRILRRLSAEVSRIARPLIYALDIIARLDFLTARAKFSRDFQMTEPEINTEGRLWLRNARHPVLEHLIRNSEFGTRNAEFGTRNAEPGTRNAEPGTRNAELKTQTKSVPPLPRASSSDDSELRVPNSAIKKHASSSDNSELRVPNSAIKKHASSSDDSELRAPNSAIKKHTSSSDDSELRAPNSAIKKHASSSDNSELRVPNSAFKKVVPIEMRLGVGFNLLIITGPNTGGKTVTLKTTGLLSVMALCGMHIPADEGSTVPLFQHILADIGDEQSLEQSLSTFSSHISRIASILKIANEQTLILFDELGAGTDPVEGAALGRAILDQLDQIGCRAIVTTHLGDLKTYAFHNDRAENGAVEFDVETLRPTYRLHIGQFGMSNALKIARRLNLPKDLLQRAHKYLRRRKGKTGDMARLQQLREEAEKARESALAAEHLAQKRQVEFERKQTELEVKAEQEAQLREQRMTLKTNDAVRVLRFDAVGRVVRVNALKQTVVVSLGLGQWEVPFEEVFPEG